MIGGGGWGGSKNRILGQTHYSNEPNNSLNEQKIWFQWVKKIVQMGQNYSSNKEKIVQINQIIVQLSKKHSSNEQKNSSNEQYIVLMNKNI